MGPVVVRRYLLKDDAAQARRAEQLRTQAEARQRDRRSRSAASGTCSKSSSGEQIAISAPRELLIPCTTGTKLAARFRSPDLDARDLRRRRTRSVAMTTRGFLTTRFGAYHHRGVPREDTELTHVGPDTPCGEYLRRFWQPICFADDLRDVPRRVTILGEELVVFR